MPCSFLPRMVVAMDTFRAVIDRAPTQRALAAELGVTEAAVSNMRARDYVHARHWAALVEFMAAQGVQLSIAELADMADRRAG